MRICCAIWESAIDKERSVWAYRVQQLLRKSQRARGKIWEAGVSPERREATIQSYKKALETLNRLPLTQPEERRLQKRLIKHKDWIFTNYSLILMYRQITTALSEPLRRQNSKTRVSGGFRSVPGAKRFAQLLSLTQTLRKQKLPILATLTAIFKGDDGAVAFQ